MSATADFLEFERPLAEIDAQLRQIERGEAAGDVGALTAKFEKDLKALYAKLGPWEKTQVARHPKRPHFSQYVDGLISDYTPLSGDRQFGDDRALLGGLGRLRGQSVVVMGHEKGKNTESRLHHNFGMANPEGYRKAVRLMELAERFGLPVISFVDTAGAYPGRGAEERGQAEAIARSIDTGLSLRVPFISVITGEGGSGGAVAIAAADVVLMLEHSIYSVISPEGCASILWKDAEGGKAAEAATAMKITAKDLIKFGIVDGAVKEPPGGAHRAPDQAIKRVGAKLVSELQALKTMDADARIAARRKRFLDIGRTL